MRMRVVTACLLALTGCTSKPLQRTPAIPEVDHHQHMFRHGYAGGSTPLDGPALIAILDEAGVRRAVVLSTAYQAGKPVQPPLSDELERVRAENDWTSREVAKFPARLVGFCGVNPLKDYAIAELRRCAANPALRRGLKLHFGNSDVQLDDPGHLARLGDFFAEANRQRMAIVVHLHASVNLRRPYGGQQARLFLERVLPRAPDVTVQIAHMGGAGGYDAATDEVLSVFAAAVQAGDPRMRNVYFDVSGVAGMHNWQEHTERIVLQMRALGIKRLLFGSDRAGTPLSVSWADFRKLPLTEREFTKIAGNVAPYLR